VNDQPAVAVGKITRAHGVRGEVAVLVLSEVEERFDPGVELLTEGHGTLSIEAPAGGGASFVTRWKVPLNA